MATTICDCLVREGKRMQLRNHPLEDYWEENPPRPYLALVYSGDILGYEASWEISDEKLYLTKFESDGAYNTSKDWVGDEALQNLWRVARHSPDVGTAKNIMAKLANLALTGSPSVRRPAQIVNALGERLLASGKLKPRDPGRALYEAAKEASRACFSNEIIPVTIETLFPGSHRPVLAAWYSGVLRVEEGECDVVEEGFFVTATHEFTRLIECRAGHVVGETVEKNPDFRVTRATQRLVPRTKEVYIQETIRLGAKFWRAVKTWGEAVDLWTDEEEQLLGLACRENFVPSYEQAIGLWELRLQAEKDGCRVDLLHPPTMHLLD